MSSKNGEQSNVKIEYDNPLVLSSVHQTEHETRAVGDANETRAASDCGPDVETNSPESLQPLTEGSKSGSSSSTDVSSTEVETQPPTTFPSAQHRTKPTSKKSSERKHILFIFRKTRTAKRADVRKLRDRQTDRSALRAEDPPRKIQITPQSQQLINNLTLNIAKICSQILSEFHSWESSHFQR